jgi:hypothetical protein
VGDRYVRSVDELIAASLGPELASEANRALYSMANRVSSRFIPGAQQQFVFRITRPADNEKYWDLLNASQGNWDVEYCYCSVFKECWEVLKNWDEPRPIKECRRDDSREFMP